MQIDKAASIAVVVKKTWANLHGVNTFLRQHPDPQADIRGVDESHILFAKVLDPDDPGVWIELTGDKQNADCAVGRVSLLVRWSQVLTIVCRRAILRRNLPRGPKDWIYRRNGARMTHRTWKAIIRQTLLNLLFHCGHRHLTRPFTPVSQQGVPRRETYVVCLDCTKQFAYDWKEMRIGEAIEHTHHACVVPPDIARLRQTKLALALVGAVPVAVLLGTALTIKKTAFKK